jgi:hypothetical protein
VLPYTRLQFDQTTYTTRSFFMSNQINSKYIL